MYHNQLGFMPESQYGSTFTNQWDASHQQKTKTASNKKIRILNRDTSTNTIFFKVFAVFEKFSIDFPTYKTKRLNLVISNCVPAFQDSVL